MNALELFNQDKASAMFWKGAPSRFEKFGKDSGPVSGILCGFKMQTGNFGTRPCACLVVAGQHIVLTNNALNKKLVDIFCTNVQKNEDGAVVSFENPKEKAVGVFTFVAEKQAKKGTYLEFDFNNVSFSDLANADESERLDILEKIYSV